MSNNMEIEAKMLLSEKEYLALASNILKYNPRVMQQTNYYLDTDDAKLESYGLGLRIREKNGNFEITLKAPLSEGLLEKNCPLTKDEFKSILHGENVKNSTFEFLQILGFDIDKIHVICSLSTYRIECDYDGGLLCIDKSTYGNVTDYELEMEHDSMVDAEEKLKQFCAEANVPTHELNKVTKHRRAMNEYNKKK